VALEGLDEQPPLEADLGLLMRTALDKIAFLPFGLLVDQYRWKVFSGEIGQEELNRGWWELREEYQGIQPPVERTEEDFDPGAKYHVAANVSYTRYFLAHILQFQFHRALCEIAGNEGPLHRCSIYGNKTAGEELKMMLEMGASKPWPDALEAFTRFHIRFNTRRADAVFVSYMELRNLEPENFNVIEGLRRDYETAAEEILRRGVAEGRFAVAEPRIAAMALIAMLTGVNTWFRERGRLSLGEVEGVYWDMVRRMVANQG